MSHFQRLKPRRVQLSSLAFWGRLVVLQYQDTGVCIHVSVSAFPTSLVYTPSPLHPDSVLHAPGLNAGLLPRIPPVGYTDRTNPFSPNAPCSLDPPTISLYNKPIIHKSIRGPSSIPTKYCLHRYKQPALSCGFVSPSANNTMRFASGLPHILMSALAIPLICPHLFHLLMNQLVYYSNFLLYVSLAALPSDSPATTPVKQRAHTIHFTGGID